VDATHEGHDEPVGRGDLGRMGSRSSPSGLGGLFVGHR
jgi:hypothetical protein